MNLAIFYSDIKSCYKNMDKSVTVNCNHDEEKMLFDQGYTDKLFLLSKPYTRADC